MNGSGDFSIGSGVWPGASKLIEEMADVLAALEFFQETNFVVNDLHDIARRTEKKTLLFLEWHAKQKMKGGGM